MARQLTLDDLEAIQHGAHEVIKNGFLLDESREFIEDVADYLKLKWDAKVHVVENKDLQGWAVESDQYHREWERKRQAGKRLRASR